MTFLEEAAAHGAQIVCFPEGHLQHYVAQHPKSAGVPGTRGTEYAITIDHPYIRAYQEASRRLHVITCISVSLLDPDGRFVERQDREESDRDEKNQWPGEGDLRYDALQSEGVSGQDSSDNTRVYAAIILISEQGEILSVGTKNHIVQREHFYEQDYYAPGQTGFQVADTIYGKIGTMVCYDRHYPESYRDMALKCADLILVPVGNEKTEALEIFEWEIRIGAYANSVNVLMCNRVGREGQMDFCGQSVFADARGAVAAKAGDEEQILYADLDLENTKKVRENAHYMALRRPEVFQLG